MSTLQQCDISIIIPVYNLERFIVPMLGTLIAQDYGKYKAEIIFVLNNCTDRTEAIIRLSELDCTIINCEIQGCGPARNAGLEIATGKYIWFMDGDDWLLSDTAVRDVLDKAYAEDTDILWIPYASDKFTYYYFSMVWQYVLRHDFIRGIRFPDYQPSEDDAYMDIVLAKAGYTRHTFDRLPSTRPLYLYNYLREGSNMWRYRLGEKI